MKKYLKTLPLLFTKKKRKLPLAFPSNDIYSEGWVQYAGYLSEIGNQQSCGGCWAFSSVGMLSDRYSLFSQGKLRIQMSAARMIMCTGNYSKDKATDAILKNWNDDIKRKELLLSFYNITKDQDACKGNNLFDAMKQLYIFGTSSEDCIPWNTASDSSASVKYNMGSSSDTSHVPTCWDVHYLEF